MAPGPVGPMGPWAGRKATVEGKPFLKTGPEGYRSRETIFESRSRRLPFQGNHFFKVPRVPWKRQNLKHISKSPPNLNSKGTLQNLDRPYFQSFTVAFGIGFWAHGPSGLWSPWAQWALRCACAVLFFTLPSMIRPPAHPGLGQLHQDLHPGFRKLLETTLKLTKNRTA